MSIRLTMIRPNANGLPLTCQAKDPTQSPALIIGFTEKILYTARIHF